MPTLGRQRQEDLCTVDLNSKFWDFQDYIERLYFKTTKQNTTQHNNESTKT